MRLSTVAPLLLNCCVLLWAVRCPAEDACGAKPSADPTPVAQAYKDGHYEKADSLLIQALEVNPSDASLNAALVHTQLHENSVGNASSRATKALADNPHSAELLTALAEVQLRQGHPWLAAQSLDQASAIDPCLARVHLIRARIYRMDSMYASEREELSTAYRLGPSDTDIWHAWLQIIRPANEIEGINNALKTTPELDADTRTKAAASARAMRLLLNENSQTCQDDALSGPITLPLIAAHSSVKEVNAYKLRVDLPKSSVRLVVDTAASGLYISRAVADANSLQHDDADPPGTVRVAEIQVGPLALRNCLVGVSDGPFPDGGEGFIGTDVFANYLIGLNFPQGRLELGPLAGPDGDLPGDRSITIERQGFTPVLHRRQFLLLPVTLDEKERQLFVLDTGVRMTTMTAAAAHAVSSTHINFTNTLKTISGGSLQVYRDAFDLQFADISLDSQKQIIEFDPSALDENVGMEVAGLLGFNILQKLFIQIDYRDGLVKFVSTASRPARTTDTANTIAPISPSIAEASENCNRYNDQNVERPVNSALEAAVSGGFDSARFKPGQAITVRVLRDWASPVCTLTPKSSLYGRVVSSTSSKTAGPSTLSLVFDHGDCSGHPKQELLLRLIGVAGADSNSKAIHSDLPIEVQGGRRQISAAAAKGAQEDENLAPELAPAIVHPGIVSGLPHLKLAPEGGPQCSALLTSDEHSVRLDRDTELIMTMQQAPSQ